MINFRCHDDFEKEIAAFPKRRLRFIRESLSGFQKLCEAHFHPINPQIRISPGKLHRVTQGDTWTMWKTELAVIKLNLRPNQYPRIWFAVSGNTIAFLCIKSHIDNYNDNAMDKMALVRISDIL